jgi:hypothetical protein
MPLKQQSRSKLPFLVLGGVGALALIGGIAYLFLDNRNPHGATPVGINLVPQGSLYTISVTTNNRDWQTLEEMGNAEAQKLIAETRTDWQQKFLAERGLDYNRDIQPWVGSQITMAQLPITPTSVAPTRQEPKIWILPIAKADQALQSLNRLGATLERRTFKGLEIRQTPANAAHPYGLVVIDQQWVVLASVPSSLETVIDTHQGQPSLLQQARYSQALAQITTSNPPFAQFYLNLPATQTANALPAPNASPSASPSASGSPSPASNLAPDAEGFAANLSINSGNRQLYFRSVTWLKNDLPSNEIVENRSQSFAERLPANTKVMYTGSHFQQFWRGYDRNRMANDPNNPFRPSQIRDQLRTAANLDFDKEFVPWLTGEFGAAILPAASPSNNPNQSGGAGLVLVAQAGDRTRAERTFGQLDAAVQQKPQPPWQVVPVQISNQKVTAWQVPPGLIVSHHGWLDNNLIFLTLGSPVVSGIVPRPNDTLARSSLFQNAMRSDLQPNNGQLYVDMRQSLGLIDNNAMLPKATADMRKYWQVINGLGVTSASRNNWSTRYDILVELLPKQ